MRRWRGFGSFIALLGLLFSLATLVNADEEIRHIGDGVTAPKLIHKVQPEYTKRAKKAKLHGVVKLRIVVASTGIPEDIKVTDGLDPDLDAEAIKAVSQWRFEPAMENGKAVPVWANVEVNFRLCCRW
jgi:periplasmic protein TonB